MIQTGCTDVITKFFCNNFRKYSANILFLAIVVSAGILYDCHSSKNLIRSCDSIIKSLDDFSEQMEKC